MQALLRARLLELTDPNPSVGNQVEGGAQVRELHMGAAVLRNSVVARGRRDPVIELAGEQAPPHSQAEVREL